jgi:hypothetical protein
MEPCPKGSYLSKRGYVLLKTSIKKSELDYLKKELIAKPLQDDKYIFNKIDSTFPIYIETKNKIYLPKMFGISRYGLPEILSPNYIGKDWERSIDFKGNLYPSQKEPVETLIKSCKENGGGILQAGTGLGKCMKIDTPILMYDGTIKKVQDIQEGEFLMGDDSTPRKVLSLARGEDLMYDIIPVKGEKYTVNQEHILCLKITGKPTIKKYKQKHQSAWIVTWFENNKYITKTFKLDNKEKAIKFKDSIKQQDIMEIAVKDYIKLSKNIKHILKGYKVAIDFPEKQLQLDPYMIGFWLGDGSSNTSDITSQDSTIIKYFKENLQQYKCYLQFKNDKNKKYTYRINGNGTGLPNSNHFLNCLNKYNLINNKHIPFIYKCNSYENRLKLLAGLIDSDGYLCNDNCTFDFVQKSEKLIDDVIYLARSLGFACYKSKQKKGCWYLGEYKEDDYYRISISGNTEDIPTLCPRKKANTRRQIKDVLRTGITVSEIGYDNYYGFEIDGNRRYVMGDFTVTHNTFMSLYVLSQLKTKTIIIVNKIPLMRQWESEIHQCLPNAEIGFIQGQKNVSVEGKDIVLAMLQSLARIDYPDSLFEDFSTLIVDEVHNTSSRVFSKVLNKICCKYTIGLSATPKRSDGCEYVFKYHIGDIVYQSSVKRQGLPPILNIIKIDSTDYKEISSINKITGQNQIQFTSMLSELTQMPKRNTLIIEMIKDLILKENRKILVLSDRRNHLQNLKKTLDNDLSVSFTYGLFLGQMKLVDLERTKASQVIFATFSAFGEGVSEKDLDTLFLITPKKFIGHLKNLTKNENFKLEQIVGRIFRKDHLEKHPLIIDLFDNFSIYKSQAKSRIIFYKKHFINGIFEEQSINLDNHDTITVDCITNITKKTLSKNKEKEDELSNNFLNQCCIIED